MHGTAPIIHELGKPHRITSETAARMNLLRWKPRETNPEQADPVILKPQRKQVDWKDAQLKRVMKHISDIHNQLDAGDVDPKGVLSLTAALDKLLVQARILRGESLPPVVKASTPKRVASSMPVPE